MGYFCVCAWKSDGTLTGRGNDFYIEEPLEEYMMYGIDVSWDPIPGAIGYRLFRRFSDENFGNYEECIDLWGAGNCGIYGGRTTSPSYWGLAQSWLGNGVGSQPGAIGTGTGTSTPVKIDVLGGSAYFAEPVIVDRVPLIFKAGVSTTIPVQAVNNGSGQLQFSGASSVCSIYFGLRGYSSLYSSGTDTTPSWNISESSHANYSHTALKVSENMVATPGTGVLTAIKAYMQGSTWYGSQGTTAEICAINAETNAHSTNEYYTITSLLGMRVLRSQTGGYARVTNSYGIKISDHTYTSGWQRPTTNYGLYIDDQTGGTTDYAIYTNAGTVRFGGTVYTGTSIIPETVADFGGASNRWNTLWCQSIDCSGFVAAGTYVQAGTYGTYGTYVRVGDDNFRMDFQTANQPTLYFSSNTSLAYYRASPTTIGFKFTSGGTDIAWIRDDATYGHCVIAQAFVPAGSVELHNPGALGLPWSFNANTAPFALGCCDYDGTQWNEDAYWNIASITHTVGSGTYYFNFTNMRAGGTSDFTPGFATIKYWGYRASCEVRGSEMKVYTVNCSVGSVGGTIVNPAGYLEDVSVSALCYSSYYY